MSDTSFAQRHDSDGQDIYSIFSDDRKTSISTNNTSSPLSSDEGDSNTAAQMATSNSSNSNIKTKSSHNMIEKKYRTNINTKFLELKNAVPTLRILDNTNPVNFDDLEGLIPAPRLNKANILSKATEYIKHLETKNRFLLNEIHILKSNMQHPHLHSQQQQTQAKPNPDYALLYQQLKYQHSLHSTYPESMSSSSISTPASRYGYQTEMQNEEKAEDTFFSPRFSPPSQQPHVFQTLHSEQHQHQQLYQQQQQQQPQQQPQLNQDQYLQQLESSPQLQQNLQNPNNNPYQEQYQYQHQLNTDNSTYSLTNKIMVGGIATLIGSSFTDNSSDYRSFGAMPITFLLEKSIKLIQFFTFISCIYFFTQPLLAPLMKWKHDYNKTHSRSLYFTILFGFLNIILDDHPTQIVAKNSIKYPCPIDLYSFPMSLHGLLVTYINLSKIDSNALTNPTEHIFNKFVLLDFIVRKFPISGTVLGFKSKILDLTKQLVESKDENSKIVKFAKQDANFINSSAVIDELSKIMVSLNATKSNRLTADELYGSIDSDSGYSSIHEYLYNTPINKINLFDLVTVLWCVDQLRSKMIIYLNDTVNNEKSSPTLVSEIHKIEQFIPTSCIKLLKCSMIFRCILQPSNKYNLDDTLKLILLNVEENLIKISNEDNFNDTIVENLLLHIHSNSTPTLSKVLDVIKSEQQHHTSLISDENRLSLLCSIILHQFSIGNYNYARSLIKFLKNDGKTCKFKYQNSITLMALIATVKTLMVALKFKDVQNKISDSEDDSDLIDDNTDSEHNLPSVTSIASSIEDPHQSEDSNDTTESYDQILQGLLCGLRLYVGQGCRGDPNLDECVDYGILNLHYGLQGDLSHRLLELAKEIAGY